MVSQVPSDARQPRGHTGFTGTGSTRDVHVERMGRVTIYKRGRTYYLYYRDRGRTVRRRVDGNLAVARLTASKVTGALEEGRESPLGFERIAPERFVAEFQEYGESVAGLAFRTVDRYKAALRLFQSFAQEHRVSSLDQFTETDVEDFVKWLRRKQRTRNGAAVGKSSPYTLAGIRFILSTCRTAMNWARRHRYLPPYVENPFSRFPMARLRDPAAGSVSETLLSPDQAEAFLRACDAWQRPVFLVLATYGLRVGELTHLLVEDVDLKQNILYIRSKPDLLWSVKTSRERVLPIFPEIKPLFAEAIGDRRAGLVFRTREWVGRDRERPAAFLKDAHAFRRHVVRLREEAQAQGTVDARGIRKVVMDFLRGLGQIPEKRIRQEFMKVSKAIGCPWLTRAHALRHFFASQAQELGMNPLMVQGILGHASLDMTARYTHLSMDAKRQALQEVFRRTDLVGRQQVEGEAGADPDG